MIKRNMAEFHSYTQGSAVVVQLAVTLSWWAEAMLMLDYEFTAVLLPLSMDFFCKRCRNNVCTHTNILRLYRFCLSVSQSSDGNVSASSAAGWCDLHLHWQSCQELSRCISAERSAVHWHFITATRITVDLLFSLIVWQYFDIFTSRPAWALKSHGWRKKRDLPERRMQLLHNTGKVWIPCYLHYINYSFKNLYLKRRCRRMHSEVLLKQRCVVQKIWGSFFLFCLISSIFACPQNEDMSFFLLPQRSWHTFGAGRVEFKGVWRV